MYRNRMLYVAQGENSLGILPKMANRHGLIAGATGTGKTTTVKVLAESFSDAGVPVFLADIKGDLSGTLEAGTMNEKVTERLESLGIEDFDVKSFPTRYWDIFGEVGHPVRVTVSQMGPVLLSNLLGLTEVQSGVLDIVFRVADDNGLKLLDYKDLRSMLQFVGENREEFSLQYGNVATASVGAIQRALLRLEEEGADFFFGEPALDIVDWMRTDLDGRGYINIFNATKLISKPKTYASFLLWLITEMFERLPEVGDPEKPRMVFFFDEAHLLFSDAPKSLLQKIVQVVKLIRSKGVGIYFISQSPSDIPDEVLAQLSNRIQHALRAYTPAEQKALKATAQAFRENPSFKTIDALTELAVGEALISFLDEQGIPNVVERAMILPPQSKMSAGDSSLIERNILLDEFELKYREPVDNESAYEILNAAREEMLRIQEEERLQLEAEKQAEAERIAAEKEEAARLKQEEKEAEAARKAAEKEEAARLKAIEKEEAAARKAAEKEAAAELKLQEKAAQQAQKEAERKQQMASKAVKSTAQKAATSAASSVARSVSTNLVNSVVGGKKVDAKTMGKRAATNALSSVMRSGSTALVRGLFGNLK